MVSATLFDKNEDLGSKAKTPKLRRAASFHFIGASLFVAQIGLDKVQQVMNEGDRKELVQMKLTDRGSVAEILDILARAPPTIVWKLLDRKRGRAIERGLLQSSRRPRLRADPGIASKSKWKTKLCQEHARQCIPQKEHGGIVPARTKHVARHIDK